MKDVLQSAVVCVSFLLTATVLHAQPCSKKVVLYLDVSDSMKPADTAPRSPYKACLNAVRRLLDDPQFFTDSDALEVIKFSDTLTVPLQAQGRAAARNTLDILEKNAYPAKLTNLGVPLRDVTQHLAQPGGYSRLVVVWASDFVNDPRPGISAADAIGEWTQALDQFRPQLQEVLTNASSTTGALLLFVATPKPDRRSGFDTVAPTVLDSLYSLVPKDRRISLDNPQNFAQLSTAIQRAFIRPLDATAYRLAGTGADFRLTFSNPNCTNVQLESVLLKCRTTAIGDWDERAVDLRRFRSIPPASTSTSPTVIPAPLSQFGPNSCWATTSSNIEAQVRQSDGLETIIPVRNGTWLDYRPTALWFEQTAIVAPIVQIDLDLTGQYIEPKVYSIEVSDLTAHKKIVSQQFMAPSTVQGAEPKRYRIVLAQSNTGFSPQPGDDMLVTIHPSDTATDGNARDREGRQIDSQVDRTSGWLALGRTVFSFALSVAFFLHPHLRRRLGPSDYTSMLCLVTSVLTFLAGWPFRQMVASWNPIGDQLPTLAFAAATGFVVAHWQRARIESALQARIQSREVADIDSFRAALRRGQRAAYSGLAIAAFLSFCGIVNWYIHAHRFSLGFERLVAIGGRG